MDCDEVRHRASGYVDDEWDLGRAIEIERHLRECEACRETYAQERASRAAIRQHATYYPAPPGLESRIRAALSVPRERRPTPVATRWLSPARWVGLGVGGSFAFAAVLVLSLVLRFVPPSGADGLTADLVADHVRSLMADHLTDVGSPDQHTVKPWFNGRLDFSPPVHDLAADGFPLAGGRLDYLNGRAVAALVYHRRGHPINVFVWPDSEGRRTVLEQSEKQGYHLIRWTQAGMVFWAVSDLNPEELAQFVQHLRDQGFQGGFF